MFWCSMVVLMLSVVSVLNVVRVECYVVVWLVRLVDSVLMRWLVNNGVRMLVSVVSSVRFVIVVMCVGCLC